MKRKARQVHLKRTFIALVLLAAATLPSRAQSEFEGVITQSAKSDFRRSLARVKLGFNVPGVMFQDRFLPDVQLEEKAEYWGVVIDRRGLILVHASGFGLFQRDAKNIRAATSRGDGNYRPADLLGIDKRTELVLLHSNQFHNSNLALANQLEDPEPFFASYAGGKWYLKKHRILSMKGERFLPESTLILESSRLDDRQQLVGSLVLNRKGRLAGLVTRFKEGLSSRAKAVYRILPTPVLLASARRIGNTRRTIEAGWLGIMLDLSPGIARLTDILHHSPAEKAGLQEGDVLMKIGGQPLNCLEDLGMAIRWTGPGSKLDLTIARAGRIRHLSTVLQAHPVENRIWAIDIRESLPAQGRTTSPVQLSYQKTQLFPLPQLGIVLEPLNAELASEFGLPVHKGLIIRHLSNDSPAFHYFRTDDVVIRINGQMICCASGLHLALPQSRKGKVVIDFYRDGELQSVQVNAASFRRAKR